MSMSQQTEHKYLINCDHGANDIERRGQRVRSCLLLIALVKVKDKT
jgi:hypothetical protein